MTLPLEEFLRRFLLHLLPPGFVRIRNFGFLANRRRAALLPLCSQLLNAPAQSNPVPHPTPRTPPALVFWTCPRCAVPMRVIDRLTSAQIQLRSPPLPCAGVARNHNAELEPISVCRHEPASCVSSDSYPVTFSHRMSRP